MSPFRYTIMLIPDSAEKSRHLSLPRWGLILAGVVLLVVILGPLGLILYSLPRALDYERLETKYGALLKERVQVMDLYRDLERLKQMEDQVLMSLGREAPPTEGEGALPVLPDEPPHPAYLENIPSVAPVQGYVTQAQIRRSEAFKTHHYGIDIAVKEGEPILAAAAGQVIFSGWTYDLGYLVILYHGNDYFTHYGHNQLVLVDKYGIVNRGDVIALTGSSGLSSGPHLHFEIWKDGQAADPLEYFPEYQRNNVSP